MRGRGSSGALTASPVLVGAVTVLVAIIAVFIAYNANAGLPFVPTYDLKAEVPTGDKLVKGNEVRVGGFRVGVVDDIQPKVVQIGGKTKAVAVIAMKLDKTVEPLAKDTTIRVRPRSALGLKYVEITPGREHAKYTTGDTMRLKFSSQGLEFEDLFSTLDNRTRVNSRAALQGYGDAFAGRGASLNNAIRALNPLFTSLTPVMQNLSNPETDLDQFFRQLGRTSAQVAPVASVQGELFANMATTFAAISSDPRALQATIEKSPSTLDVSTRSLRVQRPFLADFTDLSRRLRPAVDELPRSLPAINRALAVGTPILPRTVALNQRVQGALVQLDDLFANPNTLLALKDLRATVRITRPALEFIAPYQTVCNYFNYFIHPLGEHWSQTSKLGGTVQNQGLKMVNNNQANSLGSTETSRNADVPPGVDPVGARAAGQVVHRLYAEPYEPAIDAQGNADCQVGQNGYIKGPLSLKARYGPGTLPDGTPAGGNSLVTISNYPILSGGTYKSRELGLNNLKDVDKLR
jgi:virulence factor Mce-like protein